MLKNFSELKVESTPVEEIPQHELSSFISEFIITVQKKESSEVNDIYIKNSTTDIRFSTFLLARRTQESLKNGQKKRFWAGIKSTWRSKKKGKKKTEAQFPFKFLHIGKHTHRDQNSHLCRHKFLKETRGFRQSMIYLFAWGKYRS